MNPGRVPSLAQMKACPKRPAPVNWRTARLPLPRPMPSSCVQGPIGCGRECFVAALASSGPASPAEPLAANPPSLPGFFAGLHTRNLHQPAGRSHRGAAPFRRGDSAGSRGIPVCRDGDRPREGPAVVLSGAECSGSAPVGQAASVHRTASGCRPRGRGLVGMRGSGAEQFRELGLHLVVGATFGASHLGDRSGEGPIEMAAVAAGPRRRMPALPWAPFLELEPVGSVFSPPEEPAPGAPASRSHNLAALGGEPSNTCQAGPGRRSCAPNHLSLAPWCPVTARGRAERPPATKNVGRRPSPGRRPRDKGLEPGVELWYASLRERHGAPACRPSRAPVPRTPLLARCASVVLATPPAHLNPRARPLPPCPAVCRPLPWRPPHAAGPGRPGIESEEAGTRPRGPLGRPTVTGLYCVWWKIFPLIHVLTPVVAYGAKRSTVKYLSKCC